MTKDTLNKNKYNSLLLLSAAAVALFYLVKLYTYHRYVAIAYNTCNFFIPPMVAFCLGLVFKHVKKPEPFYAIGGMLLVFFGQNMFYFWLQVLVQKKPGFDFYKNSGSSWIFSAALIWLILYYVCEYLHKRWSLPKTALYICLSVIGLLYGFCPLENIFGIRQAMAFLPLFFLALRLPSDRLKKQLKNPLLVAGSLILILLVLIAMVLKPGIFTKLISILDGSNPYGLIFTDHPYLGLIIRCGQLFTGLFAALFALAVLPGNLPAPLEKAAASWYSLWFFGRPFVLMTVVLSAGIGRIPAMLLLCLLFVACLTPFARTAVKKVYDLPRTMGVSVWSKRSSLGIYLFTFFFLASVLWGIFSVNGKSFVWSPDGQKLYYTSLVYTRNYICQILHTLFTSGKLVIPQWDLSIGQGSSVLSVIKYNPLYFLAILFPESFMVSYFDILMFVGLFLSCMGVRFFLKSLKFDNELAVLMASRPTSILRVFPWQVYT